MDREQLKGTHVAGKENIMAEYVGFAWIPENRHSLRQCFTQLVWRWGQPTKDLMTTFESAKATHFNSRRKEQMSESGCIDGLLCVSRMSV